jgi:hypothetical protein
MARKRRRCGHGGSPSAVRNDNVPRAWAGDNDMEKLPSNRAMFPLVLLTDPLQIPRRRSGFRLRAQTPAETAFADLWSASVQRRSLRAQHLSGVDFAGPQCGNQRGANPNKN